MLGRRILDAVLIANETIDLMLKMRDWRLLCKLNIEKIYDHVNRGFLLAILGKMGFGQKLINWIKWCISSASFSILVNGSPTRFLRSFGD